MNAYDLLRFLAWSDIPANIQQQLEVIARQLEVQLPQSILNHVEKRKLLEEKNRAALVML